MTDIETVFSYTQTELIHGNKIYYLPNTLFVKKKNSV